MSITSLTRSLFVAFGAMLLLVPSARAFDSDSDHDHPIDLTNPDMVPFIDPMQFNPDYQFFAPAELGDFGHEPDPNTGWFADYKRAYIWVSRPERERRPLVELPSTVGDWAWGNVWDVGWMNDEGHGWMVSGIHVDVSEYDILKHPAINRVNEDDIDPDDDPVVPPQDRNDPEGLARSYEIHNSFNVARYSQFELDKVWRLERLHSGGILEPFVGFRYGRFHDVTRRDTYVRRDATGAEVPLPDDTTAVMEDITQDISYWNNDMFGGHLGIRWTERKSRWVFSNELRTFAQQNFQDFANRVDRYLILYDGGSQDSDIVAERYLRNGFARHDSEFVWGVDVRAEAAFEVTRDIKLLVGAQVLHFAQGIARGNEPLINEEDLQMAGVTFGAQLNR